MRNKIAFLLALVIAPNYVSNRLGKSLDHDEALMLAEMDHGVHLKRVEIYSYLRTRVKDFQSEDVKKMSDLVFRLSRKFGFNPKFILGVMGIESRFDPWAVSNKGAIGLMQIMPETGEWLAQKLDLPWNGSLTLFDPSVNIEMGIAYLAYLKEKYGNDSKAVLSAYNAGPGRFEKLKMTGDFQKNYYLKLKAFLASEFKPIIRKVETL